MMASAITPATIKGPELDLLDEDEDEDGCVTLTAPSGSGASCPGGSTHLC
jgi:hypothetical protein